MATASNTKIKTSGVSGARASKASSQSTLTAKIRIMPGAKMTYQFEEASFRVASEGWRDLIAIYDYEGRVIDFAFRLP